MNPKSVNIRVDIVMTYMEMADADKGLRESKEVSKLIRKGKHHLSDSEKRKQLKLLHGYSGLMLQSIGNQRECFYDLEKSSQYEPSDPQPLYLMAEAHAALGEFKRSIDGFETVLRMSPDHHSAFFKRELVFYLSYRLDSPFFSYNPDSEVDQALKFGLSKSLSYSEAGYPVAGEKYSFKYASFVAPVSENAVGLSAEDSSSVETLLKRVLYISDWLQLDTPG